MRHGRFRGDLVEDERCKAGINIDGLQTGDTTDSGKSQPQQAESLLAYLPWLTGGAVIRQWAGATQFPQADVRSLLVAVVETNATSPFLPGKGTERRADEHAKLLVLQLSRALLHIDLDRIGDDRLSGPGAADHTQNNTEG